MLGTLQRKWSGSRLFLLFVFVVGLLLRMSVWKSVFVGGRIFLDGTDSYYHLRRALLILNHWPHVPQFDPFLNYPEGGRLIWVPLFDWFIATVVLPFRSSAVTALEQVGAILPVFLGVTHIFLIFTLVNSLWSRRAAIAAAFLTAILPGAVRYSMVGALDHDPFYSICVLLSLNGVVRASRSQFNWSALFMLSFGLIGGMLSWGGALVQVLMIGLILLGLIIANRRNADLVSFTVALSSAITSAVILPFVLTSIWTRAEGATFEGLSYLHEAVILGLCAASALAAVSLAKSRYVKRFSLTLLVLIVPVLVILAPTTAQAFLKGSSFAAGDAPIQSVIAESRPLLKLLGPFDLRPLLVRFGLLPIIAAIVLPLIIRSERRVEGIFMLLWILPTLGLALLHSRFSLDAALALTAFGGIAFDWLTERFADRVTARVILSFLILAPVLTAYISISGWHEFNFYLRSNALQRYGMQTICESLKTRASSKEIAVLAPWYFGHWILWISGKPVVLSPFLSQGQSGFENGMRFFFIEDPQRSLEFLKKHFARYVIVTPELHSLEARAKLAGVDPRRYLLLDQRTGNRFINYKVYMRTVAARLTFWGPQQMQAFDESYPALPAFHEILQSETRVQSPLGGVIPLVRVYETTIKE